MRHENIPTVHPKTLPKSSRLRDPTTPDRSWTLNNLKGIPRCLTSTGFLEQRSGVVVDVFSCLFRLQGGGRGAGTGRHVRLVLWVF